MHSGQKVGRWWIYDTDTKTEIYLIYNYEHKNCKYLFIMTKLLNFHLHCTEELSYCPYLSSSL